MIKIQGLDNLTRNLSRYPDEALKGVVAAAQISQARIVNDAKNDHPYVDRTGNLTGSIQADRVEVTDAEVSAYVSARMQYATFVEFGTSRAKPYPFLVPAMLREAAEFRAQIARQLRAVRL